MRLPSEGEFTFAGQNVDERVLRGGVFAQFLPGGEAVWIEPNDRYQVMPSKDFEDAVVGMFGPDAMQVKSDNALPERALRKWERRGGGGDDGGE